MILPPGYAQVIERFSITGDAEPMIVTYGVSISTPGSVSMANALGGAWDANWLAETRSTTLHVGTTLRVGQDGADPLVFESTYAAFPGLAAGEGLPSNCALLVRKVSGLGGRRNRGRMFVPGVLAEATVSVAGAITPATVGVLNTLVDEFLVDVKAVAGVEEMVIFHSTVPATPTTVTDLVVDPRLSTQRRRLRR